MSQYYLMAQLPSLEGVSNTTPLPITEERFSELCERFLSDKELAALRKITTSPPLEQEPSGSRLIDAWNREERFLRLALAAARSEKLGKSLTSGEPLPVSAVTAAKNAVLIDDPLEAERFLLRQRFEFLELIRPTDSFSNDAVYYYAIKLKLLCRMRSFDAVAGEAAYKNIYSSVLKRANREVI